MKQQCCANCDYYSPKYLECEHPDQTQSIASYRTAENGTDCELWEYAGGSMEEQP